MNFWKYLMGNWLYIAKNIWHVSWFFEIVIIGTYMLIFYFTIPNTHSIQTHIKYMFFLKKLSNTDTCFYNSGVTLLLAYY
jgi:hypothetical protein